MSNPAQGAEGAETMMGETAQWPNNSPNPTPQELASPQFQAIWQVIKSWDIGIPEEYGGYCGATGSHVVRILRALASPRADSDERTAVEDGDLSAAIDVIDRCLKLAYDNSLDTMHVSGSPRHWKAVLAKLREATPAQPAGAVPDSLREVLRPFADASEVMTAPDCGCVVFREYNSGKSFLEPLQVGHFRAARDALLLLASHPAGQSTTAEPDQTLTYWIESETERLCNLYPEAAAGIVEFREELVRLMEGDPAGQSAGTGAETVPAPLRTAFAIYDSDPGSTVMYRHCERLSYEFVRKLLSAPDSTRTGQGEAEELREEVAYWRRDLAARLWAMTALYKAALDRGEGDRAADLANALRSALASYHDAENGEWYERCELCGEFVRDGEPRAAWEDVSGHARCLSEDGNGHVDPHGDEDLARWVGEAQAALDAPRPEVARPAAPEAQGAWLPISTAPRNDTLVTLGFWDGTDDPRWIAVSGWYEAGPADQCWYSAYDEERIEPTHWQPLGRLPAPPASSGQGGR